MLWMAASQQHKVDNQPPLADFHKIYLDLSHSGSCIHGNIGAYSSKEDLLGQMLLLMPPIRGVFNEIPYLKYIFILF